MNTSITKEQAMARRKQFGPANLFPFHVEPDCYYTAKKVKQIENFGMYTIKVAAVAIANSRRQNTKLSVF